MLLHTHARTHIPSCVGCLCPRSQRGVSTHAKTNSEHEMRGNTIKDLFLAKETCKETKRELRAAKARKQAHSASAHIPIRTLHRQVMGTTFAAVTYHELFAIAASQALEMLEVRD